MWLHRAIILVLAGVTACLVEPLPSRASPQADASSAENPPKHRMEEPQQRDPQSFLDGQSENDRRRMLDKQQKTFQLEIDGRYAKALKAYCDTGFGDERCFRPDLSKAYPAVTALPAPVTGGAATATVSLPPVLAKSHEARELPTIAQISGFGDELTAILVFSGGKRLRVVGPGPDGPRSRLPDGEDVISIHPGEVLVSSPGESKPVSLLFQASAPPFGSSD